MKKLLYTLMAATVALFTVGCNKEAEKNVQGGVESVEASFTVGFAGARTKASISDGTTATQLVVGVYDKEAGFVQTLSWLPSATEYKKAFGSDLTATFTTRLVKGHGYDFVFLAVAPDNGIYTIDLAKKTFTVATAGVGNSELRDAFYGTFSVERVTGSIENQAVTLTRPFAQFNAITTKKDYEQAEEAQGLFGKSAMTVTAPTVMNIMDGSVSTPGKYELTAAAMPYLEPDFDPYKTQGDYWLMTNYILAGKDNDIADLNFTLYSDKGAELVSYPLSAVPFKRNFRTNVYGSLLTTDGNFTVQIEPAFAGDGSYTLGKPEVVMYDTTLPPSGSTVTVEPKGTINFAAKHPIASLVPTYTSSNTQAGTIDAKGLFTAVALGTTDITIAFPAVVDGTVNGTRVDQSNSNYPAVTIKYKVVVKNADTPPAPPAGGEGVDVLTRELTGVSGTNYAAWTATGSTGVVYAGNSAGGKDAIQLRSNNNNSGIVSTTSGGTLSQVDVVWQEETDAARELQIYGSNTAYTLPADLYKTETAGTLLGTLKKGETSLTVEGEYQYVGLRSKSGALYLTSVSISWGGGGTAATSITASDVTVGVGKTVEIKATTNNTGATITYKSNDETIATVSETGVVTGVKVGKTTITLSVPDAADATKTVTKDINVTVTDGSSTLVGSGTKADPYTASDAVAVASALESGAKTEQVYVKGKISSIKYSFDADHGTATFNISSDGTTSGDQFTCYSVYYLENKAWVSGNTQVAVGDDVIIYGKLTKYNDTPETANKEAYIYSLNGVTENEGGDNPGGGGGGDTGDYDDSIDFSAQGFENSADVTSVDGTNFTVTFSGGTNDKNTPKYYSTGTAVRCYGGNTFTVSSSKTITAVKITFSSGEGTNAITASPGTFTTDTWSGSAKSIEFTIGGTSGHRRIKKIEVAY